ncbi:uncharacterized protein HMPREF1541_06554 [Cyphellophora europaea CBS 101466]|uniref:Uncharacterized protein n=1 Tax=Cyphellophora europaea (strain CBS 101466) TaxID=1220924 RepID=W2RS33_CYPE1|nr:uncharacterized protein HMPREF1541_06554 [Cyphellophora europaea CBS 101466]ETN38519.1 hypothetical protein HMPREF1541_06554 [Cyphellophora europaea CBS 101466]
MGLKRKASALELDSFLLRSQQLQSSQHTQTHSFPSFQQASSPPSLTSDSASPGSSPSSMHTEPFHSALTQYNTMPSYSNYAPHAPWLHTRTRKRVRDNRPSQSQIHAATLQRLFSAQRSHAFGEDAMMLDDMEPDMHTEPMIVPEECFQTDDDGTLQQQDVMASVELGAPEANQRSLHDFFARQKGKQPAVTLPLPPPLPLLEPQLRERRSFGVLGMMNAGSVEPEVEPLAPKALTPGACCLPCDFRTAEVVAALVEDAMVVG